MELLKKILLTNSMSIMIARNELYLSKVKDKNSPTFKELTESNEMLSDACLHFQDLKMETQVVKSRNRDIEFMLTRLQMYVLDMEKEATKLNSYIDEMESELETIKSHIKF